MRKSLLAATLVAAIGSPAAARDHSGYFAVEGGALFPVETHVDGKITDSSGATLVGANDLFGIKYKTGYDLDLVGGYDFGLFRLEGEVGYKHAGLDRLDVPAATLSAISEAAGVDITDADLQLQGHTRVFSGMVNGLVDFGGPGFGAYAGGGLGLADVKYSGGGLSASDSKLAWQLIAGVYVPVSDNIDLGLKYRYFQTGKLRFSETVAVDGDVYTGQLSGHFSSHSLLASIVYSFGARPAPQPVPAFVPPPPQPPVVQTCPDGSTMPITSTCPSPAPAASTPPPPPSGHPERG